MKIVIFNNGKYGVRKGNFLFGYRFLDMNDFETWWRSKHNVVRYSQGSLEKARIGIDTMTDNGSLVREEKK